MSDNFFKIAKGVNLKSQTATPANPQNGDMYYDSTLNKFRKYENGSWGDFGGSSGGTVNLLSNGDAEAASTTGWFVDSFAAATRPAGSLLSVGTGISITTSSSSPLIGTNSFIVAKDAVNRQGRVVYTPFTIQPAHQAKVLQISADYLVSSGTFVAGSNGIDSDVIFYLQDLTNGTFIEPSSIKLLSNSTTISDKFNATFQTSSNGTSYRLLMYFPTTSASAFNLKFDNIVVSPSTYVYGTPITDWQSYTPTFEGIGTATLEGSYWRRVGDSLEIKVTGVTGTVTASSFSMSLPSGLSVDPNKNPSTTDTASHGHAYRLNSTIADAYATSGYGPWVVFSHTGTNSNLLYIAQDQINSRFSLDLGNELFGSSERFRITVSSIPILGWSSSVQMSDQTDTRIVSMKAKKETTQSLVSGNWAVITGWDTPEVDTHGAFNNSTGVYTVRVAGLYKVVGQITYATNSTGTRNLQINRNGEPLATPRIATASTPGAGPNECTANASSTDFYNVGDTIRIYGLQTSGGNLGTSTSGGYNGFSIERLTGPSAIAASESVNARYSTGAGQSIPNATETTVVFGTKTKDTHGSFNASTGVFTAGTPGLYLITGRIAFVNGTTGARFGYVRGTGTLAPVYSGIIGTGALNPANGSGHYCVISDTVNMNAGDTLYVNAYQSSGGAVALTASEQENYINIVKVG
mgnify:CR=1 FL=1